MKLWTFDPNLHCPSRTPTLCVFLACLPNLLVGQLSCFCHMMCLPYLSFLFALRPCAFVYAFSFHCLSASFFVFAFACTHMERGCMELGHDLLGASKKGKMRARGLAKQLQSVGLGVQPFPFGYVLFKPPSSSSLSPLDGLYQVYYALYHSSSSLEYGNPCLFSCAYILGHTLRMQTFTFMLYVLALCMMHVYIYLLAPFQCDL